MPVEAFAALVPSLERITLKPRAILQESYRRIEQAHFIERGVASLFARTKQDGLLQIGIVGRRGFVGVSVVLGAGQSPQRCFMQTEGEALRVEVRGRSCLSDLPLPVAQLRALPVGPKFATRALQCTPRGRGAGWLLLTRDRLDEDVIPVTHDQLSMMLGVRRAEALARLQAAGAVRRCRGTVEIADREILKAHAGECYSIIATERLRPIKVQQIPPLGSLRRPQFRSALGNKPMIKFVSAVLGVAVALIAVAGKVSMIARLPFVILTGVAVASLIAPPAHAARQHLNRHDYVSGHRMKKADQRQQWHRLPVRLVPATINRM